jgi:hypothetical protein
MRYKTIIIIGLFSLCISILIIMYILRGYIVTYYSYYSISIGDHEKRVIKLLGSRAQKCNIGTIPTVRRILPDGNVQLVPIVAGNSYIEYNYMNNSIFIGITDGYVVDKYIIAAAP